MKYSIHRAAVIGSGTMGAAIAAHLANAGIPVTLLDIIPDRLTPAEEKRGLTLADREVRNRIVREGLERAGKSRPASFFTERHVQLISIGNLEDDLDQIAGVDWVIEAIVESLPIKRRLMERIDAIRSPNTIVSTNTSGIPICSIAQGLSMGFRQHFLGTHFFNPPRYLKLLEVIPTEDTLPEVVDAISHVGEYRLGKGIVPAKDTPNFIGNRLAFGSAAFALDYILEQGYTVEEVDAITGPPIGNPKTATFRLIDLVGIDVWEHVGKNLAPAIPEDAEALHYLKSERVNTLIHTLVERGALGNKSGQGFYKEVRLPDGKKDFWALNLKTLEYGEPAKVRFESIGKVKDEGNLGKRLKVLLAADDRAGQLVRALTYQSLAYASHRIPEISDTPKPMDDAMRWGFGREAGPFETWDMIGVAETVPAMKEAGFPPAAWVEQMLASGHAAFYSYVDGSKTGVYNPGLGGYQAIERPASMILLEEVKSTSSLIKRNPGASLLDLGDGIACLELHAKLNVLDEDILSMLSEGLDRLEKEFEGMVVYTDADNFGAGANIFVAVMSAQNEMWDQLERSLRYGQDLYKRLRYSPKPVVTAPVGLALGGAAEMNMHASRIVAGAELYMGLVEIGVGIIPAWGGTKEMLRRILNPAMQTKNAEALPYLQRIFEQIGFAKVATSAEEARQMGFLTACDRVVMNRDHLLFEARQEVLHMAKQRLRPTHTGEDLCSRA